MDLQIIYPNFLLIYLMFHHLILPRHFYIKRLNKKWFLIDNKEIQSKLENNPKQGKESESQFLNSLRKIINKKSTKDQVGKWKWIYNKTFIKNFANSFPKW
jgi:hypothetical protein